MKQGNQFYLDVQITDENDSILDIDVIKKVQFNIGNFTKTYDGKNTEVIYDKEKQINNLYLNINAFEKIYYEKEV